MVLASRLHQNCLKGNTIAWKWFHSRPETARWKSSLCNTIADTAMVSVADG